MEMQQLSQTEVAQLRQIIRNVADFVALQEAAHDNLATQHDTLVKHEEALDEKIGRAEQMFDQQLQRIQFALDEISQPLNIARSRTVLNEQVEKGEEYLLSLRNASEEIVENIKSNYDRLEKMTKYTVTGISSAVKSFKIDDFKQLTEDSCKKVNQTCRKSLGRIGEVIRWFHWRNLGMVFALTLVVTMVSDLYITDQWPWETHKEVMQQRNLAQAVLNVWPNLSKPDQSLILQRATHG